MGAFRERPATLLLTRAATGGKELWDWCELIRQGRNARRDGAVVILNEDGTPALRITLNRAQPTRWRLGRLDALQPGLLVEEIELSVESIDLV